MTRWTLGSAGSAITGSEATAAAVGLTAGCSCAAAVGATAAAGASGAAAGAATSSSSPPQAASSSTPSNTGTTHHALFVIQVTFTLSSLTLYLAFGSVQVPIPPSNFTPMQRLQHPTPPPTLEDHSGMSRRPKALPEHQGAEAKGLRSEVGIQSCRKGRSQSPGGHARTYPEVGRRAAEGIQFDRGRTWGWRGRNSQAQHAPSARRRRRGGHRVRMALL